jgi:hypothetical protein
MKKIISILILSVTVALTATGCESDNGEKIEPSASLPEVTAAIIDELGDTVPDMTMKKELEELEVRYYGIDMEIVEDSCFWVSPSGAYPDEIAVVKCVSEKAASELVDFFVKYADESKKTWEDYQPGEIHKFDNTIVESRGQYAALFICTDTDKALSIYNDFFYQIKED